MAITIISKDPERTWVVCNKCGGAFDARKQSSCKCGNNRAVPADNKGAMMIISDDSDETGYDNS